MTTVLAICSLIIAFGALWFTSEVVKRLDNRAHAATMPHLQKALAAVGHAERAIEALARRVQDIETQIQKLQRAAPAAEKPLAQIEREAAAIAAALRESQRFTPAEYLDKLMKSERERAA
jgi:peptidoglycan hydrolase CwlO-like protein